MKINRENVKWPARFLSIILLVAIADALVVIFMHRPLPGWSSYQLSFLYLLLYSSFFL